MSTKRSCAREGCPGVASEGFEFCTQACRTLDKFANQLLERLHAETEPTKLSYLRAEWLALAAAGDAFSDYRSAYVRSVRAGTRA